jgi:antitoxin component HigA of HigAB toxin-antitoxin module
MRTNKEKFLDLVSDDDQKTLENIKYRIANRYWIKTSQNIAIATLFKMKELNISKEDLAEKMEINISEVNNIVAGKENLTLDIIMKLQLILNINIINII